MWQMTQKKILVVRLSPFLNPGQKFRFDSASIVVSHYSCSGLPARSPAPDDLRWTVVQAVLDFRLGPEFDRLTAYPSLS